MIASIRSDDSDLVPHLLAPCKDPARVDKTARIGSIAGAKVAIFELLYQACLTLFVLAERLEQGQNALPQVRILRSPSFGIGQDIGSDLSNPAQHHRMLSQDLLDLARGLWMRNRQIFDHVRLLLETEVANQLIVQMQDPF